ncbi:hypothetical protein [Niveibacterium sp. SC-1]|uniref:hypothetical protein n=1 Tax=Niveibacterium sp. SC-1 TaxID=3135646 RepID=UPI00311E2AD6
MRSALALIVTLLTASCAHQPFSWDGARQVRDGMREDEVVALIGPPSEWVFVDMEDGTRTALWRNPREDGADLLFLKFDGARRVAFAPQIPPAAQPH